MNVAKVKDKFLCFAHVKSMLEIRIEDEKVCYYLYNDIFY